MNGGGPERLHADLRRGAFPEMEKTFHIEVFGCQMNKLDGEVLADALEARGWRRAADAKDADAALFFGCSVRAHAEDRLYSHVGRTGRFKARRPQMLVGLLGCTARLHRRDLLRRLPVLDLLAGPDALDRVPDALEEMLAGGPRPRTLFERGTVDFDGMRRPRRAALSAFVRVMRGCDHACSYCVVPRVRGRARSRPPGAVLADARALAAAGVRELILIGQDVSAYEHDGLRLSDLLRAVLAETEGGGVVRIGFVTGHPASMGRDLFEVMASDERMSRYLHMPAQSGSDRVLRLMRRGYTAAEYATLVDEARETVPELEVAGDFIVGFPGETEEDFAASVELVRRCGFINSFIFRYSERPGTTAARNMPDSVPRHVKARRNSALLEAQAEVSLVRKRGLLGRVVRVLVEGPDRKGGRLMGRTWNNHIVVFDGEADAGEVVRVRVEEVSPLTAFGRRVAPAAGRDADAAGSISGRGRR